MPTPADIIAAKTPLPTALSSAEIRQQLSPGIRARSLFSARTTEAAYLRRVKALLEQYAAGKINAADVRLGMIEQLARLGYDAEAGGFPGDAALGIPPAQRDTLRDLASTMRLKLVIDTNVRQARSVAQTVAGSTPVALALYPGWTLGRVLSRKQPRGDWSLRWQAAYDAVGGAGAAATEMTALKSSPIWAALGAGAGGYTDTLDTPYPPFAFGSGYSWRPASRERCIELGLIAADEPATGPDPASISLAPADSTLAEAFADMPPDWRERAIAGIQATVRVVPLQEVTT